MSQEQRAAWERWRADLDVLHHIKIGRSFTPQSFGEVKSTQLHHFSDASTIGYGVASYQRLQDTENRINCALVMGKSRVILKDAPSIPRLELSAATVATKVGYLLYKELQINNVKEFYWTDSQVVLSYLNNERKRFHTFVADVEQWRYVPSEINPADHASRGTTGKQFTEAKDWLMGPKFLWDSERNFPSENVSTEVDKNDKEVKKIFATEFMPLREENHVLASLEKEISSWYRMKRVLAIVIGIIKRKRFIREEPKVEDLQGAEDKLIKWIQHREFANTIKILKDIDSRSIDRESEKKKKLLLRQRSNLLQCDPFLDSNGILRVGGRLQRAKLADNLKYPVIIPHSGKIPILIAR